MNKKDEKEVKRHTKILRDFEPNSDGLQKFPFSKRDEIENRVRNLERKVKEYDTPDVSEMPIPKKPNRMTKKEFDERRNATRSVETPMGELLLNTRLLLDWIREQLPDE